MSDINVSISTSNRVQGQVSTRRTIDTNIYPRGPQGPQGEQGPRGETGNGIANIEKTNTIGLVDTYTITFTNGTTFDFNVTNANAGSAYTKEEMQQFLSQKVNIEDIINTLNSNETDKPLSAKQGKVLNENISSLNDTKLNKTVVTDAYSSSNTYAVGDYCVYGNTLYKCTTAITTAENWNSAHWTAVTVTDEIKENAVAISSTQPTTEEKIWIKKGKNFFNKNRVFDGYRLDSAGSLFSHTGYSATDFIDVTANTNYVVNWSVQTMECICYYDETKTFISRNTSNSAFTTPANCKYIRASVESTKINTAQIELGSTSTSYEAYIEKEILVKNNDVFERFFKVDNSMDNEYSTEERRIGTWIDGKPLYRKVVNFGELPNNTAKEISHNISNIDKIIRLSGYAYRPADGFFIPIPQGAYNNTACSIFSNSTKITITTYTDRSLFTECYIVIEYTKTTD